MESPFGLSKAGESQALDGEVYEVCKNLFDVHNFLSTNNLENIESQDQRKLELEGSSLFSPQQN